MNNASKMMVALAALSTASAAFAGGTVRRAPAEAPAETAPAPAPAEVAPAPAPQAVAPAPGPVVVAPAFAPHAYVGASIGRTSYSGSTLVGVNPSTNTAFFESPGNSTGGKLFAGYQFHPNFAVEAAYANLGSSGSVRGQGGVIDAVGILPLGWAGRNFNVFGKIGVADMKAGGFDDSYKVGAHYGIGVGYNFNRAWGVRAEAERFQKVGNDLSANLYTVGVTYNF